MRIRCPHCKRLFDYEPSAGPAKCPHEDCGWEYGVGPKKEAVRPESGGEASEAVTVELAGPPALIRDESLPIASGKSLPARQNPLRNLPPAGTVRCPSCRNIIPDSAVRCPACDLDLEAAFGEKEGVRAVFDVSGDITFTPRMVALLFVATLAAFLAFTWIISHRNRGPDFVPLVLTNESGQEAGGAGFEKSLQGVSFAQIKQEFLDARTTDLRREVLQKKITGQRVIWSGIIKTVSPAQSGYRLEIVMEDVHSNSFVSLSAISNPSNDRLIANISRGQKVMFSGRIAGFDTGGSTAAFDYFLIRLDDGLLLE